jgi:hypothetical protein
MRWLHRLWRGTFVAAGAIFSLCPLFGCPGRPWRAKALPECHGFEGQPVSTSYNVGSSLSDEGVTFAVEPFTYGNGETTSGGTARIDDRGYGAGSGQDVNTRNVNLRPVLPHSLSAVHLRFGELGGNVNLTINGDFRNVADLSSLDGTAVGGAVVVVSGAAQGANFYGIFSATGPIDSIAIGGQELWLDNVCFNPGIASCGTPDTTGLPVYVYNEGLATVLRGVRIDAAASSQIGIPQGYYRLGEFRIWGAPQELVKTVHVLKQYGVYVTGASTLPQRDEEWVFSVVTLDDWEAERRRYKAYDFHGHTFEYAITFDPANSCWNTAAKIDCVDVALSTQTFTTAQLNTCGWTSEPPWTTPIPP